MRPEQIDAHVQIALNPYIRFSDAIRGAYLDTLTSSRIITKRSLVELRSRSYAYAKEGAKEVREAVIGGLDKVTSDRKYPAKKDMVGFVVGEVTRAAIGEIQWADAQIKRSRINAIAMGDKSSKAMTIDALMAGTSYADNLGKRWRSADHVRKVIRQAYVDAHNEALMASERNASGTSVFMARYYGKSARKDIVFSLVSSAEYPIYADIKRKVFHPNTRYIVELVGNP